jgi:hypothetical protein
MQARQGGGANKLTAHTAPDEADARAPACKERLPPADPQLSVRAPPSRPRFVFDGTRVNPNSTPQDLGMDDGAGPGVARGWGDAGSCGCSRRKFLSQSLHNQPTTGDSIDVFQEQVGGST